MHDICFWCVVVRPLNENEHLWRFWNAYVSRGADGIYVMTSFISRSSYIMMSQLVCAWESGYDMLLYTYVIRFKGHLHYYHRIWCHWWQHQSNLINLITNMYQVWYTLTMLFTLLFVRFLLHFTRLFLYTFCTFWYTLYTILHLVATHLIHFFGTLRHTYLHFLVHFFGTLWYA